jgi:hypothetical protein
MRLPGRLPPPVEKVGLSTDAIERKQLLAYSSEKLSRQQTSSFFNGMSLPLPLNALFGLVQLWPQFFLTMPMLI